jgi:hypothetical protein
MNPSTTCANNDDDPNARIARIRVEIDLKHQAIAALHVAFQNGLQEQQQQLMQLERDLDDAYKAREMAMLEREKTFELSTQRIASTVSSNPVKLDVGGRIFSVTLDMMLKYPDSFFASLLSGRWEDKKTDYGAYFINRDFDQFHHIVSFLRNGCLDVELCESDHRREADFYQLKELSEMLIPPVGDDNWTWMETPNGVLSNGGLTLTNNNTEKWTLAMSLSSSSSNSMDKWTCSRGTIGWAQGVHEWIVRIDGSSDMVVGISLETIKPNVGNREITYWLYCLSGMVFGPNNYQQPYLINVPSKGLPIGSLISVRLDMDKRTLTFGLNGKWNDKPAITGIPCNTWYPYVVFNKGGVATIVRGDTK